VVEQNHDELVTFALTSMVLPASPDVSITICELLDRIVPAEADQLILVISFGNAGACSRTTDREQSASLIGLSELLPAEGELSSAKWQEVVGFEGLQITTSLGQFDLPAK